MPVSDVKIIKNSGGLGRTDSAKDHISGLLAYIPSLPAAWGAEGVKLITSLKIAEGYGITSTSDDETTATATITVTGAGLEDETITVSYDGLVLGVATIPNTPTTTNVATAISAAINANTATTGYSAASAVAVVTVTAIKGLGISINTGALSVVHSGASTNTATPFAGGVGSTINVINYHVEEFFRAKSDGILYVGLYTEPVGTINFAEIANVQNFSNGTIRQIGVWQKKDAFATSQLGTVQAICTSLFALHTPLEVVFNAEISATATITDLSSLAGLSNNQVMTVIGQDGNNLGNDLFNALGKSVGCVGTVLGSIAAADVATSIAYVSQFNIGATAEYQEPAYSNGTLLNTIDENTKVLLSNRRYVYGRKRIGLDGTFFNASSTSISETSDFATMENNRTIDKASRELRTYLIPLLNSKLFVNADGTLNYETISTFQVAGDRALQNMLNAGEISAFLISIDENQNVLSTSKIIVTATIIPVGVAKNIEVPLSFAVQLA